MYRIVLAALILFPTFITRSSAQELGSEINELSWLIGKWQVTGKNIENAEINSQFSLLDR